MTERLTAKQLSWLEHFLDKESLGFLNAIEAAYLAGYKAKNRSGYRSIGNQNIKRLRPQIAKWLEEEGLTEESLKLKLIQLLDAKEIKFFSNKGEITEREVAAHAVQMKALDMALRLQGLFTQDAKNNIQENTIDFKERLRAIRQRKTTS